MAKNTASNSTTNQSSNKQAKKLGLNERIYSLIASEYQSLDKKHRTMDHLYDTMMKKDILSGLSKEKFQIYYEQIANQGFSLRDIQEGKMRQLDSYLSSGASEETMINQSLDAMRDTLQHKDPAAFEQFAQHTRLRRVGKRHIISHRSSIRSLTDLQQERAEFVQRKSRSQDAKATAVTQQLAQLGTPGSATDQTNKRVTYAAIQKIGNQLPTQQLRDLRDQWASLPVDAFAPVQNLHQLQDCLSQFLYQHRSDFTDDQWAKFQRLVISNKNIRDTVKQHTQWTDETAGAYQERGAKFQNMFSKLVTAQSMERIESSRERANQQLAGIHTMMHDIVPQAQQLADDFPPTSQRLHDYDPSIQETQQELDDASPETRESVQSRLRRQQRDAYVASIQAEDPQLGAILARASDPAGFSFDRLAPSELTYYFQSQIRSQLQPLLDQGIHETMGLDQEELESYLMDIYDMESSSIMIATAEGDMQLDFTFKGVEPGSRLSAQELSPARFSTWTGGKCHVGIQITANNEDFLRDVVSPLSFTDFNGTPIHEGQYVSLVGPGGEEVSGYLSTTSEAIVQQDGRKVTQQLHDQPNCRVLTTTPVATITDHRDTVADPRDPSKPRVITADVLDGQGRKTPGQESERKIFDKDYDRSNLRLTGDQLGGLTTAYLAGQQSLSPSRVSTEDLAALHEATTDQPEDKYVDTYQELESESLTESVDQQSFIHLFQKLPGSSNRTAANNFGFHVGTVLYITDEKATGLPRSSGATYQATIDQIDEAAGTWTVSFSGTKQDAGSYEGVQHTMPLDGSSIERLQQHFSSVHVVTDEGDSIESVHDQLNDAGLVQSQPKAFRKASWKSDGRYDERLKEQFPYYTDGTHVLSMQPAGHGQVQVESTRLQDIQDEGADGTKAKVRYSKTVDYPTLRLMLDTPDATKWKPMTQDDYDQQIHEEEKQQKELTDTSKKRQRFSVGNVISGAKNIRKKIEDKLTELDNEATDDFMLSITGKGSLLRSIGGGLGAMGIGAVEDALDLAHMDIYGEKSKKTFAKITKRKEIFNQHDDTGEKVKDLIMPYLNKETIPASKPYKAAGALLFMLEKAGGPYARDMAEHAGTGFRTAKLLGEDARQMLLEDTKDIVAKLKKNPGDMNLMKMLADKEMNFIQVQIDGDNQGIKDFYGVTFADTVAELKDKMYGESINGKFDMYVGSRDRDRVHVEFNSNIKKMVMDKTIGSLKAMMELADSPAKKRMVQEAFSLAMLSGVFLHVTNYKTKEEIQKMAVRIGFMPGIWVKEFDQQHKIAGLFDFITDGKLTSGLGFDMSNHSHDNYGKGIKSLTSGRPTKFHKRRTKHGAAISEYIELGNLSTHADNSLVAVAADQEGTKTGPAGNIPTKDQQTILQDMVDTLTTDKMLSFDTNMEAGIFTTAPFTIPASVVENKFGRYNQYQYSGASDESMLRTIISFWTSLKEQTPTGEVPESVLSFVFKKYIGFFPALKDQSRGFLPQALSIAQSLNSQAAQDPAKRSIYVNEAKKLIDVATIGMTKGSGMPNEMRVALTAFKELLIANLDKINADMIADVYDQEQQRKYTNPGSYKVHNNYDFKKDDRQKFALNEKLRTMEYQLRNRGEILFDNSYVSDEATHSGRQGGGKPTGIKITNPESKKKLDQKIAAVTRGDAARDDDITATDDSIDEDEAALYDAPGFY